MVARRWVSPSLLALLFFAAAPTTEAQQPGPFFTFRDVQASGGTITTATGAIEVFFNFTVAADQRNEFINQFEIVVTVSHNATLPSGWGSTQLSQSSVVLKPGQRASISITVSAGADAEGEEARVDFRAHAKPRFQGTTNPVTEALIRSMSQESDTQKSATVKRDLDVYQRITGLAKSQPYLFLIAAGGMVALGVVLVRRRKSGLAVSSDAPAQEVLPGRGASFPVRILNEGSGKQSVSLGTSQVPAGWSAIVPVDRMELEGRESTTIWLTLKAPENARAGEHVQVSFIATTSDGSSAETLLEARVALDAPEPAPPPEPEASRPAPRRRR